MLELQVQEDQQEQTEEKVIPEKPEVKETRV